MTTSRPPDDELDALIEELTVDCYNEDEQLVGFENAFDEVGGLPCPGVVVGERVQVVAIDPRAGRRELIAVCERAGRHHDVSLLDVTLDAEPSLDRLVAAYRRWMGTQDGTG